MPARRIADLRAGRATGIRALGTVTLGSRSPTYIWREVDLYSSSSLDLSLSWMLFENTQVDVAVHVGWMSGHRREPVSRHLAPL